MSSRRVFFNEDRYTKFLFRCLHHSPRVEESSTLSSQKRSHLTSSYCSVLWSFHESSFCALLFHRIKYLWVMITSSSKILASWLINISSRIIYRQTMYPWFLINKTTKRNTPFNSIKTFLIWKLSSTLIMCISDLCVENI